MAKKIEPLLVIDDLSVSFQQGDEANLAVDGVSFQIPHGKTLCVVGESGCGKSVTSMAILGLIEHPGRVVGGEVNFDGRDIFNRHTKLQGNLIDGSFDGQGALGAPSINMIPATAYPRNFSANTWIHYP